MASTTHRRNTHTPVFPCLLVSYRPLAPFSKLPPRRAGSAARMTFFFTDHPFLGLGLVALVLGHGVALAWWIKQAMKPMARGSGDPWLLQKNK